MKDFLQEFTNDDEAQKHEHRTAKIMSIVRTYLVFWSLTVLFTCFTTLKFVMKKDTNEHPECIHYYIFITPHSNKKYKKMGMYLKYTANP